jgi:hypothetical protein
MSKYRIPAVLIAVALGGAGLSACGGGSSSPTAAGSTNGSASLSATASGSGTAPSSGSSTGSATTPGAMSSAPSNSSTNKPVAPPTGSNGVPSSGTVNFTVPAIPGDDVVTAHGSYTKLGTSRVKVTICATQTGTAYAVGALALAYNSSGASKNVGATVLPGAGKTQCGTITFLFYTAHLTVHAFIGGSNGTIVKTGPVRNIY